MPCHFCKNIDADNTCAGCDLHGVLFDPISVVFVVVEKEEDNYPCPTGYIYLDKKDADKFCEEQNKNNYNSKFQVMELEIKQ